MGLWWCGGGGRAPTLELCRGPQWARLHLGPCPDPRAPDLEDGHAVLGLSARALWQLQGHGKVAVGTLCRQVNGVPPGAGEG